MELCQMFPTLFLLTFLLRFSASVKTHDVFYVLGDDGIYVIDPVTKSMVTKITNKTSPGLCTKGDSGGSRSECLLRRAEVVGDQVFVTDAVGGFAHVIDVNTQKKQETIPIGRPPYNLHYVPWREELWVHSWNLSTYDVIHAASRQLTHKAVRAHLKPGWTHGVLVAHKDMLEGKIGYVTHFTNPGIHKLNLETKSYIKFLNFSKSGCSGTYRVVYSSYNNRMYIQCRRNRQGVSILDFHVDTEILMQTFNIPGDPFISPNHRYVVVLYESRGVSRMNILYLEGVKVEQYPELRIPGGVSHVVFYPKSQNPESYFAFVALDHVNKMAVVDLDLAKYGKLTDVRYIENVDFLSLRYRWSSRDLFISGKWIVSPASGNNTVVIIDAENQKLHGKVPNVNGGNLAVWVETPTGTSNMAGPSCFVMIPLFMFVFLFLNQAT